MAIISVVSSIILHRRHCGAIYSPQTISDAPVDELIDTLLRSTSIARPLNSLTNSSDAVNIEAVLIIATVPYTADHVMALWTHLECVTSGIDKVLISAPDTPWSRGIISAVVSRFNQLARESNKELFNLDASFYTNNRYDVGLWCDGLSLHLGFDGYRFAAGVPPRAIFLINDSTVALRFYKSLTDRITKASEIEHQSQKNSTATPVDNVKLVSLNGDLVTPGETKHYWVESVYRGLTPRAVSTFYQHSCTTEAGRACVGKTGDSKKEMHRQSIRDVLGK